MNKYQVEIQYVEQTITYAVTANSESEAAQLGTDCWAATCTGIEDGRVQPGDAIEGLGRFVGYTRNSSLGEPVVTPLDKAVAP